MLANDPIQERDSVTEYGKWRLSAPYLTDKQGVSGMCHLGLNGDEPVLLVVHDNKHPMDPRFSLLSQLGTPQTDRKAVAWPKEIPIPIDLEAVTRKPGADPNCVVATTSKGLCFELTIDPVLATLRVNRQFPLPGLHRNSNIEGCALLQLLSGGTLIAWADRGDGLNSTARLFLGTLNRFGEPEQRVTVDLSGPFPSEGMRHISDLAFSADGTLYCTAAVDGGNDGPFEGYVCRLGQVVSTRSGYLLSLDSSPTVMYSRAGHKFEAIAFAPGTDIPSVGTDDESSGGVVLTRSYPFATEREQSDLAESAMPKGYR